MPTFSLVMPVYKTEQFLKRAIESVLDQDLKDWELICVMDGYSKKATEIVRGFNDKRIKDLTIKHGGACKARNEGAKISTGRYLSFFSSDFQAVPGMLRTWLTAFEDNPKADFVYGGYKFPDQNAYHGEEFDPRQLETYNYIDGGFPLKRELWEKYPWDEKIKSLNDWDFWLRIVKAGHSGVYMPNYYAYIAEYPRQGGLSHDSSSHWLERVRQVKENNRVPVRDIVVASLGAVYHAKKVAKILDADFIQMPSQKPHEYKMIYLLGFYPQSADMHARVFVNSPKGCKKVVHWLGSDIQGLKELKWRNCKDLVDSLNTAMTAMFCESEAKQKELAEIGIKAEVLPLLRDISQFKETPMPKEFAVAIYLPGVNTGNYHPVLMENIIKNMPDVKFYLYGDRNITTPQENKNIVNMGWVDIQKVIDKAHVLLRYTIHDGLPTAPMEFLMSGRAVITNADMPHVEKIDGVEDVEGVRKTIIEKIRMYKKLAQTGQLNLNGAGDYYRQYLDSARIIKRIRQVYESPVCIS